MVRVVDLSRGSVAAAHGCTIVASLGFDVVSVEREGGDVLRTRGPMLGNESGLTRDLIGGVPSHLAEQVYRIEQARTDRDVASIVEGADVLVTSDAIDGEKYTSRLGTIVVSPFGSVGPRFTWKGRSQILFHASGPGYVTPRAPQGGADAQVIAPEAPWGHVVERLGGCFVALGIISLAYNGSPATRFDLSLQECVLPLVRREMAAWRYDNYIASRYERLWKVAPSGIYRAADGVVYLMVVEERQWRNLCELIGRPDLAQGEELSTGEKRFERLGIVEEIISDWARTLTCAELFRVCGERGVPAAPVQSPLDLLAMPLLSERGYFSVSGALRGASRLPILRSSGDPSSWQPIEFQDNPADSATNSTHKSQTQPRPKAPLAGIRVLEFTHVWAGPLCGQFLADLGADVIRVESRSRIDVHRRAGPYAPGHKGDMNASGVWNAQNRGKRSCVIDLRDPRGRAVAESLAAQADVLIENFRPGTMSKLGLGYESLAKRNAKLVYVSLSGFGQTGSLRHYPAYGPMLDALTSLSFLTRNDAGDPQSVNGWLPDVSGAIYGAISAVAALHQRSMTERGAWFDVSEVETTLALLTDALVVAANGGSVDDMRANVDPDGGQLLILPARGDDSWVALRIQGPETLRRAHNALGSDEDVSGSEPVADDEFPGIVARLLAERSPEEAAERLQGAGLEAVPVASSAMLAADPHLASRAALIEVLHPVAGPDWTYAPVLRDRCAPVGGTRPAPTFGEHTDEVLAEVGLSPVEIRALREQEAVG